MEAHGWFATNNKQQYIVYLEAETFVAHCAMPDPIVNNCFALNKYVVVLHVAMCLQLEPCLCHFLTGLASISH
jgi:hypothetical protein